MAGRWPAQDTSAKADLFQNKESKTRSLSIFDGAQLDELQDVRPPGWDGETGVRIRLENVASTSLEALPTASKAARGTLFESPQPSPRVSPHPRAPPSGQKNLVKLPEWSRAQSPEPSPNDKQYTSAWRPSQPSSGQQASRQTDSVFNQVPPQQSQVNGSAFRAVTEAPPPENKEAIKKLFEEHRGEIRRVLSDDLEKAPPPPENKEFIKKLFEEHRGGIRRVLTEDTERRVDAIVQQTMRIYVAAMQQGGSDTTSWREAIVEAEALPQNSSLRGVRMSPTDEAISPRPEDTANSMPTDDGRESPKPITLESLKASRQTYAGSRPELLDMCGQSTASNAFKRSADETNLTGVDALRHHHNHHHEDHFRDHIANFKGHDNQHYERQSIIGVHPSERRSRRSQQAKHGHGIGGFLHDHNPLHMFGHHVTDHDHPQPEKEDSAEEDEALIGAGIFADSEAMKDNVRIAMAKDVYDVRDYYFKEDESCCAYFARKNAFSDLTLFIIGINSLWIAVDVDLNDEAFILNAHPIFIIADNFFCLFFCLEWIIRYSAFRYKSDCFKDAWFVFDSGLCLMTIVDTWVLTAIVAVAGVKQDYLDASVFKTFRMVRLIRMTRMIRLLNAFPELMVVIKGMGVAARAVASTIILMLIIIYVFAVGMRQLTDKTEIGALRFSTVLVSMRFLLLTGTVPDLESYTIEIWDAGILYAIVYMLFALIISITVMNMLVGVLVGVVNTVAEVEKEQLMVDFVRTTIHAALKRLNVDEDHNGMINQNEFAKLIQEPSAIRSFDQMGVDVVGLCDLADYIFADGRELPFSAFMELVMELRGSNKATVKDIVDLRKFFLLELRRSQDELEETFLVIAQGQPQQVKDGEEGTMSTNQSQEQVQKEQAAQRKKEAKELARLGTCPLEGLMKNIAGMPKVSVLAPSERGSIDWTGRFSNDPAPTSYLQSTIGKPATKFLSVSQGQPPGSASPRREGSNPVVASPQTPAPGTEASSSKPNRPGALKPGASSVFTTGTGASDVEDPSSPQNQEEAPTDSTKKKKIVKKKSKRFSTQLANDIDWAA